MRCTKAWLVAACIAVGCVDGPSADPAPICTEQVGCPEGSRCVDGLVCERVEPGPPPPTGEVGGGPVVGAGSQRDGGAPDRADAAVARGDAGLCAGRIACDGECVDETTYRRHCGACGVACPSTEECRLGVCCGVGDTVCGAECVDLATSRDHCGVCGVRCEPGLSCVLGSCLPDDPSAF